MVRGVWVAQVYASVKIQSYTLRFVHFIICKLYLKKEDCK